MPTSCSQDKIETWDVTGDPGTTRLSLVFLRIMTSAFYCISLYLLLLSVGAVFKWEWVTTMPPMQFAFGMASLFILGGLWLGIIIHPLSPPTPKFLKITIRIIFLIGFVVSVANSVLPNLADSPFAFILSIPLGGSPLLLIAASLAIIPITRAAWVMKPGST